MSIKDFFLKKMIESKLSGVPKEEQERIMKLVEQNPELFQRIALEIQEETKKGKDQMAAAMDVMRQHEEELRKLI